MRYMVTGAAGFLGSHLCDALLHDGHVVIGVDSLVIGNPRNLFYCKHHPRFAFIERDLCESIPQIDVDGIFHLASPTAPAETVKHRDMTLKINSDVMQNMVEFADKQNAKLLFASSVKVEDKDAFASTYIIGKRNGENICFEYGKAKIARMGNIYGPRMAVDDSRVIPAFLRNCILGRPLSVWGDGGQLDSFCFFIDAVRALVSFMDSEHTGLIEIGEPSGITIKKLAYMVIRATGIDVPIIFEQPGGGYVVSTGNMTFEEARTAEALKGKCRKIPDISLARKLLKWEPVWSLNYGLQQTFEYYKTMLKKQAVEVN